MDGRLASLTPSCSATAAMLGDAKLHTTGTTTADCDDDDDGRMMDVSDDMPRHARSFRPRPPGDVARGRPAGTLLLPLLLLPPPAPGLDAPTLTVERMGGGAFTAVDVSLGSSAGETRRGGGMGGGPLLPLPAKDGPVPLPLLPPVAKACRDW